MVLPVRRLFRIATTCGLVRTNRHPLFVWRTAESGQLGVLDFTAKWCGPCRSIAPIYEQLSTQYPNAKFYKVDIDNPDVGEFVSQHGVSSVPTFTFYKGGKQISSFSGAQHQLLKDILAQHGQ